MNQREAAPAGPAMRVMFDMCSQARCLPIVRATVGQMAAMVGWDESESRHIMMAVDEALTNVIRHAYHGSGDGRIELHCCAGEGELEFRIRDTGDPPDRSLICAREVGCDKIGGLGTHIIRDVMDSVSYETHQEGNWFVAVKRLQRKA
jgi:anti-sigma regulatory factor (Ser/Thr protein kinase)